MKAVIITKYGGPEVLQVMERPVPEPTGNDVRVKIHFAGVNRSDLLQRRGYYPAPAGAPSDIPGLELMGIVDALGPDVILWQKGQRVFGLLGGGGYSEYAITNENLLALVPDSLSDVDAAAVPEVFMTAHDALIQANFKSGDHVLIHAAGSGVATAAIQLVHALKGISYGTARSEEKLKKALELGLDAALPLPDFLSALRNATNGKGVNIVLDFVGAPYFRQNLEALRSLGSLVQIGTMGGSKTEIDLSVVLAKRLRIIGTVLRSRSPEEKSRVTKRFIQEVIPLLENRTIHPVIDRIFPLESASEAHAYLENNANFGKVLLRIS
ncbi:MAG: NAD(P)H-quinone oxidoreductase [Bacteroidota bacterium]|nr:NAD(P)H-quinone oxidoreductase [Bacteroidota bacterium]